MRWTFSRLRSAEIFRGCGDGDNVSSDGVRLVIEDNMRNEVDSAGDVRNRLRREIYLRLVSGDISLHDLHTARPTSPRAATHGLSLHQLETIENISNGRPINRNQYVRLRVSGLLDLPTLRGALVRVTKRHEILRTNFVSDGSGHKAVVRENGDHAKEQLIVVEGGADQDAVIQHALDAPFDIASELLFRVVVDRRGKAGDQLILVVDHLIFDGWSFGVLMTDLQTAYRLDDNPATDAPRAWQFRDFVSDEIQALTEGELDADRNHWKGLVRTLPAYVSVRRGELQPRSDRPRLHAKACAAVPEMVQAAVANCCQIHRVSPFSVYLGAFTLLISAYSGVQTFPMVSPMANRSWRRSRDVIGPLSHSIILGVEIDQQASVLDLLASLMLKVRQAARHERFPWTSIKDFTRSGLTANFYFGLQNYPVPRLDLGGLALKTEEVQYGPSSFEIAVFVIDDDEGRRLEIVYDTDVVDGVFASEFIERYWVLLTGIGNDPTKSIRAILMDMDIDIGITAGPSA